MISTDKKIGSRLLIAALSGFAACSALAYAAAGDPMQAFYDNTMVSKHPDGQVFRVQFNKDHTFVVLHNGKIEVKGSFTADNGKLCMVMDPAKPAACHPFRADRKIGESWTETTPMGIDELSLEAGRNG
jgi:hypothetical protein